MLKFYLSITDMLFDEMVIWEMIVRSTHVQYGLMFYKFHVYKYLSLSYEYPLISVGGYTQILCCYERF